MDDRAAILGVAPALRAGGPVAANASIGLRIFSRQYLAFLPWLGLELDGLVFMPAYTEYLYGYKVGGFDSGIALRVCFSPGWIDVCPSLGGTSATFQAGTAQSRTFGSSSASLHADVTLGIVPHMVLFAGAEVGYYFRRFEIAINGNANQLWAHEPWFAIFSVGIGQRIRPEKLEGKY